jgi:hypothetical protein
LAIQSWKKHFLLGLEVLEGRAAAMRAIATLGVPLGGTWEDREVSLVAINIAGVGRSVEYVHWRTMPTSSTYGEARIVSIDGACGIEDGIQYLKYPAFGVVLDLNSKKFSVSVVHPAIGVHLIRRPGKFRSQAPPLIRRLKYMWEIALQSQLRASLNCNGGLEKVDAEAHLKHVSDT